MSIIMNAIELSRMQATVCVHFCVLVLALASTVHCNLKASLMSLHVLPLTWAEGLSCRLYARGYFSHCHTH